MPAQQDSHEILDQEFFPMRAKILQLAAALDRIDRAEGDASDDIRCQLLRTGIAELLEPAGDRAESVQQVFSRPYDPQWQADFGMQR